MNTNAFPALPIQVSVIPLVFINLNELQTKTEAEQNQQIGELIYPFVNQMFGGDAPKITGMLLTSPLQSLIAYCQNRDIFLQAANAANAQLQQAKALEAQAQVTAVAK
jgi:hypothetical protein